MKTEKYGYDADVVRSHARGAWLEILSRLAPTLDDAIARSPRHVTCPFPDHGGEKDFRLFRDAAETGGGVCTCGTSHDGFELLMRANGWNFSDTLREVGDLIGAPKKVYGGGNAAVKQQAVKGELAQPEKLGKAVRKYVGRITEFGVAPFRFDENNSESFFVKLEDRKGAEQQVWGVDLEPALKAANAQVGHVVVLSNHGRQPVKLLIQPTQKGEKAKEREVYKNVWRCKNVTKPEMAEDVNSSQDSVEEELDAPIRNQVADDGHQGRHNSLSWLEAAKSKAAKREEKRKKSDARAQQAHADLWNQCIGTNAVMASPFHRYLHGRGINITMTRKDYLTPENVRFSISSPYYEENEEKRYEKIGDFPALVCAVRSPEGEILTLHRTYLTSDGKKAPVDSARKMMPVAHDVRLGGSAIRLGQPQNGYLAVAEGLETALAATQGSGIPCWSTVNASLLAQFEPPKDVHTLVIFADKDRSRTGEIAAAQLQARLETEGVKVLIMVPPQAIPEGEKGIDWNDVLKQHGLLGFPCRRLMDRMLKSA